MNGSFFEAVKALFSRSRAFQLFVDNNKRKLIEALSELPANVRHEAELVYSDLFPETTRFPERWEQVFSLYLTERESTKRRDIIDAHWKIISGDQGTNFLEQVLRSIDPNFCVVENVPLADPRNRQSSGIAICDYITMVCDNGLACCDYLMGNGAFIPSILQNDKSDIYTIPDDKRFWEVCFFVCKSVVRNDIQEILYIEPIDLTIIWKNIVEYLILKIKPVHSTAVIFVNWIEDD